MQTTLTPNRHQIAEYLIDERISDMIQYLIEDYSYPMQQAFDLVYQSHTMSILEQEESELYVQSSRYVYDMLIQELGLYPIHDDYLTDKVAESR